MQREPQSIVRAQIRRIDIVVDVEDPLAPELTLPDFVALHGRKPDAPNYRILRFEVLTCPDDNQPILASECAKNPRFIRRTDEIAYFRRN
jgi:hypothetical protein